MDQPLSIRQKQLIKAKAMLSPNPNDSLPDWKFIIYDLHGRDIMDSLFSHKDLRGHYVTLRLPINLDREQIPDPISAIYFIMPTEENIKIICQDLKMNLYDSYYFNFISELNYENLELISDCFKIAQLSLGDVKQIKSQYLNYISIEDNFFILKETNKDLISYYAINRSDSSDDEITLVIDQIVDGLFSLLVTLDIIPIIRCPKGGPAEVVADRLTQRLRKQLANDKETNDDNKLFKRKRSDKQQIKSFKTRDNTKPLLCLVDRTVDMSTPLHHTWTYQALLHDLFDIKLNLITIQEDCKAQLFDLSQEDKFWQEQKGNPFPQVADAVQRELDEFKKHKDDITNSTIANTERLLKKHTTIATAILDEIKSRKLDNFFETEEKIMNRSLIDRVTLDEMLAAPEYGQPNDKYRLFLISYICDNPNLTEDEAEKYMTILEGLGCNRRAYEYVKRWKIFSKINVETLQSSLQSSSSVSKTARMFTKLMSQGSQFVMEGVKNLILKEHHLPLTKIVDSLMDSTGKQNKWSMEYRYFDPEAKDDNIIVDRKKFFTDAIVFVVGGGNYIEYQNLVDYCKSRSPSSNIVYGATDLMNPNQFLCQLDQLGNIDIVVDQ